MQYTENYNLGKYDYTDAFDVAAINDNFDVLDSMFSGLTIQNITQTEYDEMDEHSESVIYVVTADDGSSVTLYKGDTQISGKGGGGGGSGLLVDMWELSANDSRLSTNGWSVECSAEICTYEEA